MILTGVYPTKSTRRETQTWTAVWQASNGFVHHELTGTLVIQMSREDAETYAVANPPDCATSEKVTLNRQLPFATAKDSAMWEGR